MICRYLNARFLRGFYLGNNLWGLALNINAQRLDMRDMDRDVGLPPNLQRLVNRARQANAIAGFIADMAVIQPAFQRGCTRQINDFVRPRKALRGIEKPSR